MISCSHSYYHITHPTPDLDLDLGPAERRKEPGFSYRAQRELYCFVEVFHLRRVRDTSLVVQEAWAERMGGLDRTCGLWLVACATSIEYEMESEDLRVRLHIKVSTCLLWSSIVII